MNSKSRVIKVPRSRRRAKTDKEPSPDIPGPLSEVTKHMLHIPLKDMEALVHRPITERRMEVAKKKNGKVSRPMNSFMLYRSAYTDRIKALFHLNNHQEVSRASGKSWGMETPLVRTKYEELANIEKDNHCRAHPHYKFAPKKETEPKGKRRRDAEEDCFADCDDPDFAPGSIPPSFRLSRDSEVESNLDSRGSTPFDHPVHGMPTSGSILSWQTSNPSQPDAGMMPADEQQYLQTSVHPCPMGSHVEDVCIQRGYPDVPYTSSSELAGLPGASHYNLVQPQTPAAGNGDGQLDPRLLMHGSESPVGAIPYHHSNYPPVWHEPQGNNSYLPVPSSVPQSPALYPMAPGSYHPGMQPLMDQRDSFESGHGAGFDAPDGTLGAGWTFVPRGIDDDLKTHDDDGYELNGC